MAKPTDQELVHLLRQTKKVSLQDIRLVESHTKLGILKEQSLPTQATQTIGLNIQVDSANHTAVVVVSIKMTCAYEDSQEADPPVLISARFGLQYSYAKPTSRKLLERIVQQVALLNVWPFWREFAQSTTVRMGLPAFPVPLMNFGSLAMKKVEAADAKKEV